MKTLFLLIFVLALSPAAVLPVVQKADNRKAPEEKIEKSTIQSGNQKRTYYLYVPASLEASASAPLLVLLHGSGRNGFSQLEKWKPLAAKEGIILVGPDAYDSKGWAAPKDGPDFLRDVVELLKSKYPINARRVYLFGHSAGAVFSIYMSLYESQYFAAAALHAGALNSKDDATIMALAKRKIPMHMWVGNKDPLFPLSYVRATRDLLNRHGFAVQLTEIANHDHNYYIRAAEINQAVWDFLKAHELPTDPVYEQYQFSNK